MSKDSRVVPHLPEPDRSVMTLLIGFHEQMRKWDRSPDKLTRQATVLDTAVKDIKAVLQR
jgi:hypothetical protein